MVLFFEIFHLRKHRLQKSSIIKNYAHNIFGSVNKQFFDLNLFSVDNTYDLGRDYNDFDEYRGGASGGKQTPYMRFLRT